MVTTAYAAGISGIDGFIVSVECSATKAIPDFQIIGLPDASIREAKDRIRSAARDNSIDLNRHEIILNLAPAYRKKEGSAYDAAILAAISQAVGFVPRSVDLSDSLFIGELSLDGHFRAVNGVLPMCIAARDGGFKSVFVPEENTAEASVVDGLTVYALTDIRALAAHLKGTAAISPVERTDTAFEPYFDPALDFADVRGQYRAKRAMEIAAAGGHNILLIGPPGTGKSMLAKRLPTILPPLTFEEALEVTRIHSVSGTLTGGQSLMRYRPFRAPHSNTSGPALIGGGSPPVPGEVSLAHNGVLFLDEMPEFAKNVTESLRQPLEDGCVTITRATGRFTFPSRMMLVCAMNPCRCGYFGSARKKCSCTPMMRRAYLSKISGPLLDRIDIQVEMPELEYDEISGARTGETSSVIRERVIAAREISVRRFKRVLGDSSDGKAYFSNAQIEPRMLELMCPLDAGASNVLRAAYDRLGLSVRGRDRLIRVARTVADLDGAEAISARHISEAISLRSLDKNYWSN